MTRVAHGSAGHRRTSSRRCYSPPPCVSVRPAMPPAASIVIVTKNRKEDLRKAVDSALAQTAAVEVIVIDDGSTDATSDLLATDFPAVRCVRAATSRGYIVQRNRAAELATAPVV